MNEFPFVAGFGLFIHFKPLLCSHNLNYDVGDFDLAAWTDSKHALLYVELEIKRDITAIIAQEYTRMKYEVFMNNNNNNLQPQPQPAIVAILFSLYVYYFI